MPPIHFLAKSAAGCWSVGNDVIGEEEDIECRLEWVIRVRGEGVEAERRSGVAGLGMVACCSRAMIVSHFRLYILSSSSCRFSSVPIVSYCSRTIELH